LSSLLHRRVAVVAAGALAFVGLGTTAASADGITVPTVAEIATGGSDGWNTSIASTGSATFVAAADAPLGHGAARLSTGAGDAAGGKSGKAYLFQNSEGGTPLSEITGLHYSTKVETLAQPGSMLAPSMGLSLMSDAGWQGTLVFEPIYQDQTPTVGAWQDWDATAGKWWFTKDVVDQDANVVLPKQSDHSLAEFQEAFDANPAKYGNLQLDPRGGGVQVYAGNSTYMEAWNGFSALVDNVTVGTADGESTTWDLEQGLGSVPVSVEDNVYTLLEDAETFSTITAPNHATIDGAGHTITAVEDAEHPEFKGAVLTSAVGDKTAAAELNVKNLHIATRGFAGGPNGTSDLTGIQMHRAGGTLTNVSVNGISEGDGHQEGNAISIRNRVELDNIDVPRAHVALKDIQVSNYQKTGLLLDGNLSFTVDDATVGAGAGPEGQDNSIIAANSLQISRGASGAVTDSRFALNSHAQATAVLLYNAKNVDFDRSVIAGDAPARSGISVQNVSNTIDTNFTLRNSRVERSNGAGVAGSTGLFVNAAPEGAITASVTATRFVGWEQDTTDNVVSIPVVSYVDVTGKAKATRPKARALRITMTANELGPHQIEAKPLRWRITVDGRLATTIRQHAGDSDVWAQRFGKNTGSHTVQVFKNGELRRTLQVATR
jgi:hypothetical protein